VIVLNLGSADVGLPESLTVRSEEINLVVRELLTGEEAANPP
jgi:hypothetical protein